MAYGYVTTILYEDNKLLSITSYEGDHDCCYQRAALNKDEVAELIATLTELHAQMEDVI